MKELPINKFGTKLMVASKSVNKIPDYYLKYAQNVRIYDGGIGPAKGKQILTKSTIGTNNKGAFVMNNKLYQVTNSRIYEIDINTGIQTEKANLGYDSRVDVTTYIFPKGNFVSLGNYTDSYDYSSGSDSVKILEYIESVNEIRHKTVGGTILGNTNIPIDIKDYIYPAIEINYTGTTGGTASGTGSDTGTSYILENGEYMNLSSATQIGTINYNAGYYDVKYIAIIVSEGKKLQVFDGTSLITPATQPASNNGIIEYTRGFTFIGYENILYISRAITVDNPEYSYDFTGTGSQQIAFDSKIVGLISTLSGLYIFTENTIEFLGANSLQNVAGSATFISQPIGKGGEPINSFSITASGDKIFYITKNKKIRTVNFIGGIENPTIGDLSSIEIVSFDEYLDNIDINQTTAFSFNNKNDNTIQFHLRLQNAGFNNICVVYDLINDTWVPDKGKYYNYVVEINSQYYGFSDINSSIYKDDIGNSIAGSPIPSKILTQEMNQKTLYQKLYGGFFTAGAIGPFTKLKYKVLIEKNPVFEEYIEGEPSLIGSLGEIGGDAIGEDLIGGDLTYEIQLMPFERLADEGRIFQYGNKIQIEITSMSEIQDFLIDILGIRAEVTTNINIENKF